MCVRLSIASAVYLSLYINEYGLKGEKREVISFPIGLTFAGVGIFISMISAVYFDNKVREMSPPLLTNDEVEKLKKMIKELNVKKR